MANHKELATIYNRFLGDHPPSSTFAVIRDGSTVQIYDPSAPYYMGVLDTYTASPTLFRAFISFDLTGLTDVFDGVNLNLFCYDRAIIAEPVYAIEGKQSDDAIPTVANWISENALTQIAANIYAERLLNSLTEGVYNTFTLNANGIAFVKSKVGGQCHFCLMSGDDFDDSLLEAAHNHDCFFYLTQATGKEPELELVNYTGGVNKNFGILLD